MNNNEILKREFSKISNQYPELDFQPYCQALQDSINQIGNLQLISIDFDLNQDGTMYYGFNFQGTPTTDIFNAFTWLEDDDIIPQLKWNSEDSFTIYFTI